MMGEPGTQYILVLHNGQARCTSIAEADELYRKRLAVLIPDDFPRLEMPETGGEPLADYVERAINQHRLIVAMSSLHVVLAHEPPPPDQVAT